MFPKFFTLEEAQKVLPTIRELIVTANAELERLADDLLEANERCHRLERKLTASKIMNVSRNNTNELSASRQGKRTASINKEVELGDEEAEMRFEAAADELATLKNNYDKRLNYWFDKITEQGVILRDLRTGLLDFPARQGEMIYFLCWHLADNEIHSWHLIEDGFAGRRPLAVLIEYM